MNSILLGHGSGGKLSHDLIKDLFVRYFHNPFLDEQTDSALLEIHSGQISFTTDSFVVDPIFFPGGDIGKLSVCGTVNDLAVSGAVPEYLSASFIIEEGFPLDDLEKIVISMANEAEKAGVQIVTGDTKVVNRTKCDKIFINTTGIGRLAEKHKDISSGRGIQAGDKIIINGSIGDHGMAVLGARDELNIKSDLVSDCACLNHLIQGALDVSDNIRFMRDATRGGLATVLAEVVEGRNFGIRIDEAALVINEKVRGFCELLGFDPMYVANEGKLIAVVPNGIANEMLQMMKSHELGKESQIIGEAITENPGIVVQSTGLGANRIVDMPIGEQLPRIC